jgi:hypothetical protein
VTVESPRPKATIITIKIRSVIIYLINNFFCLNVNIPLYQTVTSQFYSGC